MSYASDNIKIASNTLLLYVRMLLLMVMTLYTSRIVLDVLGITDFGIFSAVGGLIAFMVFFNSAMTSTTQRYLAFYLGQGDQKALKSVFNAVFNLHLFVAVAVLILAETVGLWFFYKYLNLPPDRLDAAFWVYQFSVLAFVVKIVQVPFSASIIASEKMAFFSYISALEVILVLLLVLFLQKIPFDHLMVYGFLLLVVGVIVLAVYRYYCHTRLQFSSYGFRGNKALYKELGSYSGWSLIGNLSFVARNQGANLLLNLFFGTLLNAAWAVAAQVQAAVRSFVANFLTAVNPQIIKSYAAQDFQRTTELIFRSSRLGFLLLFFLSLPLLLETRFILDLWLVQVPDYAVILTQLLVLNQLIDSFSGPLITAVQATGKIKKYQIVVGGILLLNLPFTYLLFRLGAPPQTTVLVSVGLSFFALVARLGIIGRLLPFKWQNFIVKTVVPALGVVVLASLVPGWIFYQMETGWIRFVLVLGGSFLCSGLLIYYLGLDVAERNWLGNQFQRVKIRKR